MSRRCKVCGKLMHICQNDIGPSCLRKLIGTGRKNNKFPKIDMFEEKYGQRKDETTDECIEEKKNEQE